jgi:hypothetical protein
MPTVLQTELVPLYPITVAGIKLKIPFDFSLLECSLSNTRMDFPNVGIQLRRPTHFSSEYPEISSKICFLLNFVISDLLMLENFMSFLLTPNGLKFPAQFLSEIFYD